MNLQNFKSIYPTLRTLYGIDVDPDDFEEIALVGWRRINNKHTRLYKFTGDVKDGELSLPCNVVDIESVTIPIADAARTSNKENFGNVDAAFVEQYIDAVHNSRNPFNQKGTLVDYKEGDGVLYFARDYKHVTVVYHGVIMDDEDLPLINAKEADALALFVTHVVTYKDALRKHDKDAFTLAEDLNKKWLRACNAARISEHYSQNDMNAILDARAC